MYTTLNLKCWQLLDKLSTCACPWVPDFIQSLTAKDFHSSIKEICGLVFSQVDNSSVIEIDFIRSDIFEEVLNYMYTAKISVKKRDVNLMMSSGQILGIRFLDKLCSQVTLSRRSHALSSFPCLMMH